MRRPPCRPDYAAAMTATPHLHTQRLELDDQTLREWDATVLKSDGEGLVLDRSAFYPGGGGQPPDEGVLLWGGVRTRIVGVRKGDELYLIPVEGDPVPPAGTPPPGAPGGGRGAGGVGAARGGAGAGGGGVRGLGA